MNIKQLQYEGGLPIYKPTWLLHTKPDGREIHRLDVSEASNNSIKILRTSALGSEMTRNDHFPSILKLFPFST